MHQVSELRDVFCHGKRVTAPTDKFRTLEAVVREPFSFVCILLGDVFQCGHTQRETAIEPSVLAKRLKALSSSTMAENVVS